MKVLPWCAAPAACVIALVAGTASADELISNLPGNDGSQSASLQTGRIKAMGFTMPAGLDYFLDSADLRLNITGLGVDPLIRIFDDVGGLPTNELVELVDPPIGATGIETYSFTTPGPFVLEAGKTYWVVAYNIGADSIDWKASSPSQTPTGLATHAGSLFSTTTGPLPPTGTSSILCSYAIQGTAVPAPGALALAGLGGLLAARRRR
ncbi:MAG: choice-of-anchor R domain-containing protein [Phycisphaerales bacterium JB039]